MSKTNTPFIGIFDSGLGGLTVLKAVHAALPGVALRYVADSGYAPYGGRGSDYIIDRSLAVAGHLLELGARMLVVACNTATVHAVQALRERWPATPIVAIEPGIKPAVASTVNGRVGVLATVATLASARYQALLQGYAGQVLVFSQPCPGLVDQIETGQLDRRELLDLIERYCAPLREAQVDTVLLACTHYPFVQPQIQLALGQQVQLLNIEDAVARQAKRLWQELQLPACGDGADIALSTTGNCEPLRRLGQLALGSTPQVGQVSI
ncbi:glutamate racemase [Paucibacter soli]|uniref:glutamate racemase n=1 Tax=Paucibacter soli TaxID=3133433 RepID=UPI0030B30C61